MLIRNSKLVVHNIMNNLKGATRTILITHFVKPTTVLSLMEYLIASQYSKIKRKLNITEK